MYIYISVKIVQRKDIIIKVTNKPMGLENTKEKELCIYVLDVIMKVFNVTKINDLN